MQAIIKELIAREILDSRGNPTIEVDVHLQDGSRGRAAVPSGASTGAYEAHEGRDGDQKRYMGKGVLNVVNNVNNEINDAIINKSWKQKSLDSFMIELDGTDNKSRLGANGILGVSLAFAKALAVRQNEGVYRSVALQKEFRLPVPLMNVLNGGAHANNGVDIQEFMIVPHGFRNYSDSLRAGAEIFQTLKKILNKEGYSTAVGDEGGFAPQLKSNEQALQLLTQSVELAGYKLQDQVSFALDVASTEFYDDSHYNWQGQSLTADELISLYKDWCEKYPIVSIEDGLAEDDWIGWHSLTIELGNKVQLVGDDLFVTNAKRLRRGIDEKCANAILIKVNQIGTLTETIDAIQTANFSNYRCVMSHRSGETEDTIIADLSVGLNCQQIKTGSLCRSERVAKYNQLLRIESELSDAVDYWGSYIF